MSERSVSIAMNAPILGAAEASDVAALLSLILPNRYASA